jgi:hypothetical protein
LSGVHIVDIKANDVDTVGELRYFIADDDMKVLFMIDSISGALLTATNDSRQFTRSSYKVG